MSKALVLQQQLSPELRLAQAISEFEADLPQDEKAKFKAERAHRPDPVDVMRLTAQIDRSIFEKGIKRGYGPRLTKLLEGVQQFAAVGDVLVGGSQYLPACAVWTLVRFSLLSIVQYASYMDKLSEIIMQIGRSTPRYQDMALLFPQSKKLQDCFTEYYIIVVHLCHKLMKVSQASGFKQFLTSYDDTITRFEKQLETLAGHIRDEMNIQAVVLAQSENKKSTRSRMLAKVDREASEKRRKEKQKLRFLDACSIYDYQTTWKQTRKSGNTALYKEDPIYQDWKIANCASTFVQSGRLGAGKSVLLSNIVDDLFLNPYGHHVTYFFCRHDILESLLARTVVGSLTRQLLLAYGDFQQLNLPPIPASNSFGIDDLSQIIREVCSKLTNATYLVIDGLDECTRAERDLVLEIVNYCQKSYKLLVCVSSRWEPDAQSKFRSTQLTLPTFSNMPTENTEVESFVSSEIDACISSGCLQVTNMELVPLMKTVLFQKSGGMFLWVSLLITYICGLNSDHDIVQALEYLPQSLVDIYQRLLDRHIAAHQQYQEAILQLVLVAYRPLTAQELREALSVTPGTIEWDLTKLSNDIAGLLACCGGIIIIDEEESSVRFVHESARQFLVDGPTSRPHKSMVITAEKKMAQIIATYLNYVVFETQVSTVVTPNIPGNMVIDSVLSIVPRESKLLKAVSRFVKSPNTTGPDISRILAQTAMRARACTLPDLSFRIYAKRYWLFHCAPTWQDFLVQDLVRRLFRKGLAIEPMYFPNPLSWTISNGYTTAFEGISALGIPLEENMQEAIEVAAGKGYRDIVEKYLDHPELFLVTNKNELEGNLLAYAVLKKWSSIQEQLLSQDSAHNFIWNAVATSLRIYNQNENQAYYDLFSQAVEQWSDILKAWTHQVSAEDYIRTDAIWRHRGDEEANAEIHKIVANRCLGVLLSADCLWQEDICNLRAPNMLRRDINEQLIRQHIPLKVQYACLYWTHHLRRSNCDLDSMKGRVLRFLKLHFLVWFEAVSLIGQALRMESIIKDLAESFLSYDDEIKAILIDARHFVVNNADVVDVAPLQLYRSSILFSPKHSKVIGAIKRPNWLIATLIDTPNSPSPEHHKCVTSVAFSPNGGHIATSSVDGTIKCWSAASREVQRILRGHSGSVTSVVFSPNGEFLASDSTDLTIKLWTVNTGELQQTLRGSSGRITSVDFSPDGLSLASGTENGMIELWSVPSGEYRYGHHERGSMVTSVTFSPDGKYLASVLSGLRITLLTISSRHPRRISGYLGLPGSLAFSPDGMVLAVGGIDGTIRLFDTISGQLSHTIPNGEFVVQFSISNGGLKLHTSVCTYELVGEDFLERPQEPATSESKLIRSNDWLIRNGQRLILLPKEYREAKFAERGGLIVFGMKTGFVMFFEVSLDELSRDPPRYNSVYRSIQ